MNEEREITFEEWSKTETAIFNLCLRGKMNWRTHREHVFTYNRKWNFQI